VTLDHEPGGCWCGHLACALIMENGIRRAKYAQGRQRQGLIPHARVAATDELVEHLAKLRADGWSWRKLAAASGLAVQTLYNVSDRAHPTVSHHTRDQLLSVRGTPVSWQLHQGTMQRGYSAAAFAPGPVRVTPSS
jgi:hypothetical protein